MKEISLEYVFQSIHPVIQFTLFTLSSGISPTSILLLHLINPALKTLRNVANIRSGSTAAVAQVIRVNRSRVVLAERRVNRPFVERVAPVLEVRFEMLGPATHHSRNLVLKVVSAALLYTYG